MKIIMFSPDYFPPKNMNANHNRLFHTARSFQLNNEVYIICPNDKEGYGRTMFEGVKILRFPHSKKDFTSKISLIINSHIHVEKTLKREKITPDIIWYNSGLACMLARKFDCIKIYDVMGIVSDEIATERGVYPYIKSIIHRILENSLYKKSSIITTINNAHKRILSKKFHKKIYVIRDAFDNDISLDNNLYEKLKKRYKGNFVLFFVGSFGRKRFEKNIAAFESLLKQFPNIRIIIAGDGKYLESYKKRIYKLGIMNNFNFIGHVSGENLNSYIKAADICFSDVFLDGFPYKIFEYMAMGKVSLVERTRGVEEILVHGNNSLLYSNSKDFEKNVINIMNDFNLRKRIEKQALVDSKKNTWNKREEGLNMMLKDIREDLR